MRKPRHPSSHCSEAVDSPRGREVGMWLHRGGLSGFLDYRDVLRALEGDLGWEDSWQGNVVGVTAGK